MEIEAARMIGAGLAVFGLVGVGVGIGMIFSSLIKSIARNPEMKKEMRSVALMGFALTEAVALFAMLISFIILFK